MISKTNMPKYSNAQSSPIHEERYEEKEELEITTAVSCGFRSSLSSLFFPSHFHYSFPSLFSFKIFVF